MDDTTLDTEAAASVHYTDPRVRQLAEARWRLNTGQSRSAWLQLGKDNPEALIREGRDWIRAAVAAGILPPPSTPDPRVARLAVAAEIAAKLKAATSGDVWHAVALIHEVAAGRMDPEAVRSEFEELELPHA